MNIRHHWPGVLASMATAGEHLPVDLRGDSIAFLKCWAIGYPFIQLVAINPDGPGIEAKTVPGDRIDELRSFIDQHNGRRNLYFCLNPLSRAKQGKATKADVPAMAWLHVDMDPRDGHDLEAERARIWRDLETFRPRPTVIIDSGNGYQAFWRLRRPVEVNGNADSLEAYNKCLSEYLGGDHCHSLDHLMRLPGTVNLPNPVKQAKGRKRAPATLVHFNTTSHDLSDFEHMPPPALRGALTNDPKLHARWHGSTEGLDDNSRSGMDMSLTAMLVHRGFNDDEIRAALLAFEHGKAREEGDRYITRTIARARTKETADDDRVILPSDYVPFIEAAGPIFARLAERRELFVRGTAIVERNGAGLELLTPHAFRSRVEKLGPTYAHVSYRGEPVEKRKRLPVDSARTLMETEAARELLPLIRLVAQAPLLTLVDGSPVVLGPGYNEACGGVLVESETIPPEVPLTEAVEALRGLLRDFDFLSPGDEARALLAMITPALRMGALINGPCPVDIAEADQSQAGKTLRQRLVRTIYGEAAYPIACKNGGVGSLDESLSAALLSGRPFVSIDNVRGRMDSQFLEMVTTWSGHVAARVPHRGEVHVDASGVVFQLTSNGVETTRDLANRSSIVRIHKRPRHYQFYPWPEGGLVEHVEARQAYYLGCVQAVVRTWIAAGRPSNEHVDHDMREWAGVSDWIAREVFKCPCGLMDGHTSAQERVSNPDMVWLRALALAVIEDGQEGHELSASALVELSEAAGLDLPRTRGKRMEDSQAARHVGVVLGRLFNKTEGEAIEVDGITVERFERNEYDANYQGERTTKRYVFRAGRTGRTGCITPKKTLHFSRSKESCAACAVSGHPKAAADSNGQGEDEPDF